METFPKGAIEIEVGKIKNNTQEHECRLKKSTIEDQPFNNGIRPSVRNLKISCLER